MSNQASSTHATEVRQKVIVSREDGKAVFSPVLLSAHPEDLPPHPSACQVCPNSMWLNQNDGGEVKLQNYCMIMRRIVYSPQEPVIITDCDGLEMGAGEE